ncbi:Fibrillin-1-like [Oopsacas minuta]|uniref:Fibrillin-1-like n=1 Tax=Oopsacas minuta TaxID=111878 RepID=A0AAV7K7H9_9METZ|nr:Fibrillin-1-like [Oopsacas minuta]
MNPSITVSRPQLTTPAGKEEKLSSSRHNLLKIQNVPSTLKANRSYMTSSLVKQTSIINTGPKKSVLARAGSRMFAPPQIKDSAGTELTPQNLQLNSEPYIDKRPSNQPDSLQMLGEALYLQSIYNPPQGVTTNLYPDICNWRYIEYMYVGRLINLRGVGALISSYTSHNLMTYHCCNNVLEIGNMNLYILQNLFLLFVLNSVCNGLEVCVDNSDIHCLHYEGFTSCTIRGTNTTAVSMGIFTCSGQSLINIDFSEVMNIEVDLKIKSSKTVAFISSGVSTVILLRATAMSNSVTSIQQTQVIFDFTVATNFTQSFPNLDSVNFQNPIYSQIPTFVHNDKLTSIVVKRATFPVDGDFAVSSEFIGGLTLLRIFEWTDSSITSIIPAAFSHLNQLSSLKLSDNKITHLRKFSFQGSHLPVLLYLWLSGNDISIVDDLAFDNLALNQLYLDSNPHFPLESLVNISSLQSLSLANNGYDYFSPDLIYNLDFHSFNLANNPFNCSCALQWANIAQIFITFNDALCTLPSQFNGLPITDPAPYANCTQSLSYQCFNHSILCMGSSQCINTPTSAYCSCVHVGDNYGYSQLAKDCIVLLDECAELHDCDQICTDTIDSYECDCNQGFDLYEQTECIDVNECLSSNGFCQQECINNVGSYECGCFPGYELDTNITCIDVNECIINNGTCEQICTNMIGSYQCGCYDGYEWNVNNTCVDIDECETAVCESKCFNSIGTYKCGCFPGYELDTNITCIDVNECIINNGTCEQICTNMIGSYQCGCYDGYEWNVNNTCVDIDECETAVCESKCFNSIGTYKCGCFPGYELDTNITCIDVNECIINNGTCEQICTNMIGSYQCGCYDGYEWNVNNTCVDIDECETAVCESKCFNSIGTYACGCSPGYNEIIDEGGGTRCQDINECKTSNGGCSQYCFDTKGSYYCACYIGFEMNTEINQCIDIDECIIGSPCDQICINNIGGYSCACNNNSYVKVANGGSVLCTLSHGMMHTASLFLMFIMFIVSLFIAVL